MLKRSCRNTCTSTNLNISVVCWNTSCYGNSRRLNCHFTVTFIAVKQHKERVRALWQRTTAHWNQERVKRKFPTISMRDCLSADGRCWWVVLGSAGWWMNTRVNPCGWWIWPEPLVVPTSPSLPPSPGSVSSPRPRTRVHQSLVWSEETCFLSCFHHFTSDRNVFPLSYPFPLSLCLLSASLFLFPLHLQSILLRRPAMAQRSKCLANVFKCSVKHPYSG